MENPQSYYQSEVPSLNKFYPNNVLKLNNFQELYQNVSKSISEPAFRNPMKNFIDENCASFVDVSESSFEQYQLFKEFNQLLENLLQGVLIKLKITQEEFLKAAEYGLKDPKYKKYFNQIINFGDYNFFKLIMVKRNYQIIKMAEQQRSSEQDQINEAIRQSLEVEKKRRYNGHHEGSVNLQKELKSKEPQKKEEIKPINKIEPNLFPPKMIQNIINLNANNNQNQINENIHQSQSESSFNLLQENKNKKNENELISELQKFVMNNLDKGDVNNNDFVFRDNIQLQKVYVPEDFNGKIPNYTTQKKEELRKFRDRVIQKKIQGREVNDDEQNK